jgi:hypothetical protein
MRALTSRSGHAQSSSAVSIEAPAVQDPPIMLSHKAQRLHENVDFMKVLSRVLDSESQTLGVRKYTPNTLHIDEKRATKHVNILLAVILRRHESAAFSLLFPPGAKMPLFRKRPQA